MRIYLWDFEVKRPMEQQRTEANESLLATQGHDDNLVYNEENGGVGVGEGGSVAVSNVTTILALSTFVAACIAFGYGCALGYSSPTQSSIMEDLGLSVEEFSLFGSMLSIGAILGAAICGKITDWLGRKMTMWILNLFYISGWLAIAFTKVPWLLDLGRLSLGFTNGISGYLASIYIAEITTKNVRGRYAAIMPLMICWGMSFMYVVGSFVDWRTLALIATIPGLVQLLLLFFIPESPRWLAKVRRDKELEAALLCLRGNKSNISDEATEIKDYVESLKSFSKEGVFKIFQKKYVRPLLVCTGGLWLSSFLIGLSFFLKELDWWDQGSPILALIGSLIYMGSSVLVTGIPWLLLSEVSGATGHFAIIFPKLFDLRNDWLCFRENLHVGLVPLANPISPCKHFIMFFQLLLQLIVTVTDNSCPFPFPLLFINQKYREKMSSSRQSHSSNNSGRSRHSAQVIAQTTVDAKLHAEFEESSSSFDYSSSVRVSGDQQPRSDKVTTAYLHNIQKGKFIQPFGCLLALDEKTYKVIAYSDNAPELLTMVSHAVPSVGDYPALGIGTDIKTIFTAPSSSALLKALGIGEVSLLNPILVHCKTSGKPFYAIVHRVTGSLIIDFEPVKPYEVPMTAAGALQSYKLAAKAITRLQSLPSGSMERLCDTMVQEVFELTGYDRVMAYKFHDDDHGEVVSEITKPGLEPYLGLHYPATDIPQAARFLFMKNKVRMIVDCRAKHVKVYQDDKLPFDLTFCGSTLRAPHSCHLQYMENMNSIASLVMAVIINDGDEEGDNIDSLQSQQKRKRLWGLVVCHNTTPRFVPFPLRYACEFLAQVFSIHVNKELELEIQMIEKNILRTQTLLCDMLMRDAPVGIVSQSPNIMDLVKCDGAALLYKDKIWKLGVTPSDSQLYEIASWLSEYHMDSTGLSTDSLYDAGFPGALKLGGVVCGMAAVRITPKDMLFWFRSHTAAEIRWGGAKHELAEKDDDRKMHPRSSFKAFLEVVKTRSLPWKDYEMDGIHSLQLILRNAFKDVETPDTNTNVIYSKLTDLKIEGMQELEAVTSEMVRLIETATVPILAVDVDGLVNGWNMKIAELTGLSVDKAIGKHLLALLEDSSVEIVKNMLFLALQGKEEKNIQFEIKTHGLRSEAGPISLVVNACVNKDLHENAVGVCFVAQDITGQKIVMDKFTRIEGDYKAIVQNPNPLIPPIFGMDEFGWCSEWNPAMTKLTGWNRDQVIDKMLLGEVFGTNKACCRLKNNESYVNLGVVLNNAVAGHDPEKVPFGFFARKGKYVECLLCVNKKLDSEGAVTGVFCFLQLASHELQQALHVQRLTEQTAMKRLKALAYLKKQIHNPLSGIIFSSKMMEGTELGPEQKRLLQTSTLCQRQLRKILDDSDLHTIIDGCVDLEMMEFTLHEVLIASISQVTGKSNGKCIRIVNDTAEEIMSETLYGDSVRLQQVLADFLLISVNFTPQGGRLVVVANLTKDQLGHSVHLAHLELRITHAGGGVPEALLNQVFGSDEDASEEGISLLISRKLVKLMNGDIQYLREAGRSTFIVAVELAAAKGPGSLLDMI
ncbi:hypothetical protein V6N13_147808 [Hibiscus sabdariffa]